MDEAVIAKAWNLIAALSAGIGPRVAGSAEESASADLIGDAFSALGLEVAREPFRFVGWEPELGPELAVRVGDGPWTPLASWPMPFTGTTGEAGVSGRLVPAGVCELVPDLLEWPRYEVVDASSGRSAFVAVVPHGPGRSFPRPERQLLLEPVVITGSDAFAAIGDAIQAGIPVQARIRTGGRYVQELSSQNVIAEIPGAGPETIVIGAHYDSVAGTPGAGDNASGVGGMLALAETFAAESPAKTLRFAAWGAHEVGLLGSQFHMQERAQRRTGDLVTAMIALDILSDGDRIGVWSGSEPFHARLAGALPPAAGGFPVEHFPRGRGETDSWSFAERGIDTVMILTLPYSHFHLPTDTIENNDPALFRASVEVAEGIVRGLLAS